MKEYSVKFSREMLCEDSVDVQLNKFLIHHKNYKVKTVSYSHEPGKCVEYLFVVFTVDDSIT